MNHINIDNNGERRKDGDRRQFAYTFHLPERRNGIDRRDKNDHRKLDEHTEVD